MFPRKSSVVAGFDRSQSPRLASPPTSFDLGTAGLTVGNVITGIQGNLTTLMPIVVLVAGFSIALRWGPKVARSIKGAAR